MSLPSNIRWAPDAWVRSGSAAIGLGGIVALWTMFLVTMHNIRDTALANARSETANLARVFEEQITRSVKAVDQSLMFVRENWARAPDRFDAAIWARNASAVTDVAIQLTIVGTDGWTKIGSTAANVAPVDLRDREHIRFQMESDSDELFISKPVIGRVSHRWSIQFTRKLFNAAGQFDGVAVVSLDPSYLTRIYNSIDLGAAGAVTLFGTDGVVRAIARNARADVANADLGTVVPIHMHPESVVTKGRVTPVDFDGVRRVTSFRKVNAYPLIVAVGLGESDVLADYDALRRTDGVGAIALTVLLAAATGTMLLLQRRHAKARAELRESERLFAEKSLILETALEHMNQGILMVDGDRKLKVCNRRASAMLGLPPELAVVGAHLDDVIQHQWSSGEFGEGGDRLPGEILTSIRHGGIAAIPQTYERQRPSGEVLEIRSVPLEDGGVVRTYTDISVRKAFEEDLRTAHDQAHAAARAKSEFLAVMSHEIRSPLSGLVGAIDLLRVTELREDQAYMAKLAHGSAQNLLAILNDILDFSKIEAGALTLSIEPVDVRELISELTQPHALVARTKGVALHSEIDSAVPALIQTDRLRLGQIVTNLLSNAVKFTGSGSVALLVAFERYDGDDRLRIAVRDTGCGMEAATLDRLFQPFTQGDGSSSRIAGGTGLGLCISKRLAQVLDGTLTVESQPGNGSCFTLLMRCIAVRQPLVAPQAVSPTLDQVLTGLRILVVDDNPTNQWLTWRQLLTLGATVETACNGPSALEALNRSEFDAIITDCHMPGMDGAALAQAVRTSRLPCSDRPIIGLTADVTREQALRCSKSGMNDLLYKPVSRARLAQALGRLAIQPGTDVSIDSEKIFDGSIFESLFDWGDPDGPEWLRSFCDGAAIHVRTLGQLASASTIDRVRLATVAHTLVGSCLSVGAHRMAQRVRKLEEMASEDTSGWAQEADAVGGMGQPARITSLVEDIEADRRLVVDAIETLLLDPAPA